VDLMAQEGLYAYIHVQSFKSLNSYKSVAKYYCKSGKTFLAFWTHAEDRMRLHVRQNK